jgi:hypothetical protein
MQRTRLVGTAAICAALVMTAACGSGGGTKTKTANSAPTTTAAAPVTSTTADYHPTINPADFSTTITNKYLPLKPGVVRVLEGTRDGKPQRAEITVTNETKMVMGVKCVVVRDVVTSNGALIEQTVDWFAQHANGDVWYFGEDTKEFTNGVVSSTHGSWEGGVDGALPGTYMKANPKVGDSYRQEYRPGQAEDTAAVQGYEQSIVVPAGTYKDVLVNKDTDPLNPDKNDTKKFAPGVGMIYTKRLSTAHHEELFLVKVTGA